MVSAVSQREGAGSRHRMGVRVRETSVPIDWNPPGSQDPKEAAGSGLGPRTLWVGPVADGVLRERQDFTSFSGLW